jgi:glycosyltransferase involved in cell wall biosynthesis
LVDSNELTILMPCLNEAETVATCVAKARRWLDEAGVDGEVLVADNGSTDGSQALAREAGARVVAVAERGYGAALRGGIAEARGRYVIMGDADDTYDFSALGPFLERLRAGDELVVGNRFRGGIEPGAMPFLHRRLGNPLLSAIGRLFFRARIGDFHCGLRGFNRAAIDRLGLQTTGMEFASEMVVRAPLAGYRISEVPTTLSKGGRTRQPHLRTWSDGWRHLRFLLLFSPRWLFEIPGTIAATIGLLAASVLTFTDVHVGTVTFSTTTLLYAVVLTVLGWQSILFAGCARVFAIRHGLLPDDGSDHLSPFRVRRLERGILLGLLLAAAGLAISVVALWRWGAHDFGDVDRAQQTRIAAPAILGLVLGGSLILSSFMLSVLQLGLRAGRPTTIVGPEPTGSPTSDGEHAAVAVGN